MIECSICKAHNEDRSLYCLECGQRLKVLGKDTSIANAETLPTSTMHMQGNNQAKLHSPILDLGGQINTKRPNNISRNGLHSPLLDGRNYFDNPHPYTDADSKEEESEQDIAHQANSQMNNQDRSRLHSPVLDGPSSTSFAAAYIEESFTQEEEYESLRSPLLKAKVPLPEKESVQTNASGNSLNSILSSATGPAVNTPGKNMSVSNKENSFISPLSITGINKLAKANSLSSSERSGKKILDSQSELQNKESLINSDMQIGQSKNSLNKMITVLLVFFALGFKIWYILSLGSAAFASTPFAFDQGGQIIVLLLILMLVLN